LECDGATAACCLADSFTTTAARVCAGQRAPCVAHTVQPGQTLEHVAALHGTTTWQLRTNNALLESGVETAQVALRHNDVLAVRPSPKPETLRWQWTDKAGATFSPALHTVGRRSDG
jgi:hypothetical protein